jgi:hypothetical protein
MADLDIYEVRFISYLFGQVGENVRYYRQQDTLGTGPTQTQIAQAIDATVATALKGCMVDDAAYKGSLCARIWPTPRVIANITTTAAGAGSVIGDPLPLQLCGVITLRTLNAGRRWRGRVFVPFPPDTFSGTDGTPFGAYITALTALGTALLTTVAAGAGGNTANMKPVLARPKYTNHVLTNPDATDLFDYVVRDKWGTQRRRGNYGQPNPSPI